MSTIVQKVVHELRSLIPVTLYFLFADLLLSVTQMVLLREYGLEAPSLAQAVVMALVVAKVVLLLDMLPLMARYQDKPVLYNVLWSTGWYFFATLALQIAEDLVKAWISLGDLAQGANHFLNETYWPHFILVQFWMFVLLFNYCLYRGYGRALGPGTLTNLLLRKRT